ncbi:MAG: glycosyltransferase family protein [Acidobacteriaceae bacterium]
MRFLIVPNYPHPYDQRIVRGLADALSAAGHHSNALVAPLPDHELIAMCQSLGTDVLMQVNRFRPVDPPLPANIRHITWLQDVFPETVEQISDRIRDSDVIYTLGAADVLGLNFALPCFTGTLVTGVDEATLHFSTRPVRQLVDFSLCGFIPKPVIAVPTLRRDLLWYLDDMLARAPFVGRSNIFWVLRQALFRCYLPVNYVPYAVLAACQNIVESLYRPLRGELDIHFLCSAMRESTRPILGPSPLPIARKKRQRRGRLSMILRPYSSDDSSARRVPASRVRKYLISALMGAPERTAVVSSLTAYFSREYPRLLDRVALIEGILGVSRSVELYGPGWSSHEQFKPYYRGVLQSQNELLTVYKNTCVNLANNTHGLGLHSRTLECMAVGGFILTHASPNDTKPGGMHTSFEPGVHYGMFTPDNLREEARRWLTDEKQRINAGLRAAAVIREKHLWRHRAQQILNDLKQ